MENILFLNGEKVELTEPLEAKPRNWRTFKIQYNNLSVEESEIILKELELFARSMAKKHNIEFCENFPVMIDGYGKFLDKSKTSEETENK